MLTASLAGSRKPPLDRQRVPRWESRIAPGKKVNAMFRIFGFKIIEFPPETSEFLKFGNRLLDYLETKDQAEIDALRDRFKATNDRLAAKLNQSQ